MSNLNYKPITLKSQDLVDSYDLSYLRSKIYRVSSLYEHKLIKNDFINLRANIVDLNPAMIVKCIQGTEQDFKMLMDKAKEFLRNNSSLEGAAFEMVMQLFQECVFGYYILTPLIESAEVSDIKVYAWNHITCKVAGRRYKTNLSFASPDDYNNWYNRILRIHRMGNGLEHALQHNTDRKGVDNFLLRIDYQLSHIVSSDYNIIHIRKLPKTKYSWQYLIDNGMLDENMITYIKDRVVSGYGFLLSGRGGSGKSTLLNNIIDLIPYDESVLISQESDELYSKHPQMEIEHVLEINRGEHHIEYSLEEELRIGLLQDIDNFVIGEIKGGEALYVFTTGMSTGARFFGTIHSNNAIGSVRRLAHCARYISDYSVEALEEMFSTVPFCLIHMSHFSIDEIVEVTGWDSDKQCLIYDTIYKKDFRAT